VANIFKVFKTKLYVGETFIRKIVFKNTQKRRHKLTMLSIGRLLNYVLKLGISYHNIRYSNPFLAFCKGRSLAFLPASKQMSPHLEYLLIVLICPSSVKIPSQGYFDRERVCQILPPIL
jgi:hypothetical protein